MSVRAFSKGLALASAWVLVLQVLALAGPVASNPATDPKVEAAASAQALLRSVRHIAGKIEEMRGEKFMKPAVAVRVPDDLRLAAAEIRAGSVVSRQQMKARGRAWADLGLGGAGSPARLLTLLSRDLKSVGFDPSENRLLVAPNLLTEDDYTPRDDLDGPATVLMATGVRRDEPLFGHMLMHVRQRERASMDYLARTTDALLARSAFAEGEANLLALRYLFGGMGLANDMATFSLSVSEYLDGKLVPEGLDTLIGAEADLLRFVYLDGFAIAVELFQQGGWQRIDKAQRQGQTTRDILHPDREPLAPATFSKPQPPLPGVELVDQDVLGEQGIIVLVSRLSGKDNLALDVGDGWVGDRLYRWEGPEDAGATEWVTRWATPEDVEDFIWGLGKMFKARYPGTPLREEGGTQVLAAQDRLFRIDRTALEVRVLVLPATGSTEADRTGD